jgi:hypothetical protein
VGCVDAVYPTLLDVFLAATSQLEPASALILLLCFVSTPLEHIKVTSSAQLLPLAFSGRFCIIAASG